MKVIGTAHHRVVEVGGVPGHIAGNTLWDYVFKKQYNNLASKSWEASVKSVNREPIYIWPTGMLRTSAGQLHAWK